MSEQLELDFSRPASPAPPELPRDPLARGYAQWLEERARFLRELEARYGVVLNRQVRLTLAGFPGEFTGRLVLDELLPPTRPGEPLRLRIGQATFDHTDIESCTVTELEKNA